MFNFLLVLFSFFSVSSFCQQWSQIDRFVPIEQMLTQFLRPFTFLEVGVSEECFSLRAAPSYPNGVFVIWQGDSALLSTVLIPGCPLNNVIWLKRNIHAKEVENLSLCEHVDVSFLCNNLPQFKDKWEVVLDSFVKMSYVVIVALPSCDQQLSHAEREWLPVINHHLSLIATRIIAPSPLSAAPVYYVIQNPSLCSWTWTTLEDPDFGDQSYSISCGFENKRVFQQNCRWPCSWDWAPGINLITFLMMNGAFPSREEIVQLMPPNCNPLECILSNMMVCGKLILCRPFHDCAREIDFGPLCSKQRKSLNRLILNTLNESPKHVRKKIRKFCN